MEDTTEKIIEPAATEEKAGTDQSSDLLTRLSAVTERKEPGTQKAKDKTSTSYWESSDDDFESVEVPEKNSLEINKESAPAKKSETIPGKKEEPKTEGKISERVKLGSAKTAVGMIDLTCKGLLTPILTYKTKKKLEKTFDEKQTKLIEEKLMDAELNELDAAEKRIKKRFDSIMAKYQKKVDAIPMSEPEKKDMTDAFYNYFDYTQTSLSPGWYLGMAITDTVGKRMIDVLTD